MNYTATTAANVLPERAINGDKVDYEHFKLINSTGSCQNNLQYPYGIDTMLSLDAAQYPALKR